MGQVFLFCNIQMMGMIPSSDAFRHASCSISSKLEGNKIALGGSMAVDSKVEDMVLDMACSMVLERMVEDSMDRDRSSSLSS